MRVPCLVAIVAFAACSANPPGGSSAAGTSNGGISSGGTSGGGTTGEICQTTWPPRDCFAIAICECADGTRQDFGCIGPPTCADACCPHGGPFVDAGACQTSWPPRDCFAIAICECADGKRQDFGCIGPPTCADACCSHDGPRTELPLPDAGSGAFDGGGALDGGAFSDGGSDAGASDGGACQSRWPERGCLAESICGCADGTSQQFGCVGPPTCGDACCGHGGPGPTFDAGVCVTYPPLPCDAIIDCSCNDGTTQLAGCAGPPNCADACCAHEGVKQ